MLCDLFSSNSSIPNATRHLCFRYEGQACRGVFSTTLLSVSSLPRLHPAEEDSTESVLQSAVTAISENVTHPGCNSALTTMLCHYTMPPCYANNNVTQFCVTECHELLSKCGHFIQQLEASVNVLMSDKEFSFPRCSELQNASGMHEASNKTCTKLGLGMY